MKLLPFQEADLGALTRLWNGYLPARYHIDTPLLALKTSSSPFFNKGASVVAVKDGETLGWVAVKNAGNWPGADASTGHICALIAPDPKFRQKLLDYAITLLEPRRLGKVTFGADPDHFWPGCPLDAPELLEFLTSSGFEQKAISHDVERDLSDYQAPEGALESLSSGATVRRCNPADRNALDEFFARAFPGRWRHDVMLRHSQEPDQIFGLWASGKVEGFALTQNERTPRPIAGGVWRDSHGLNWCALGPIGLSEATRGRGWGHGLLAAALVALRDAGGRHCSIDWTNLLDFYGRHGFESKRQYAVLIRHL